MDYQLNGNLVPGIHIMTWEEFVQEFGFNSRRLDLISGLQLAVENLRQCNCKTVYVDGSFVSRKIYPNDFDACYDTTGMDLQKLASQFPEFFELTAGRIRQKQKYKGELFPMHLGADGKRIFIDFFQRDRDDNPKGIIQLNI